MTASPRGLGHGRSLTILFGLGPVVAVVFAVCMLPSSLRGALPKATEFSGSVRTKAASCLVYKNQGAHISSHRAGYTSDLFNGVHSLKPLPSGEVCPAHNNENMLPCDVPGCPQCTAEMR